MRLRIHRGAQEIGGNCVELESGGCSILLDLGLPLDAVEADACLLPPIGGLSDGSNPALLGVVLSHIHGDHYGLTGLLHDRIPVFMGRRAEVMLRASQPFVRTIAQPRTIRTYDDRISFGLGPFRITPYLTDHSGFDAYSPLIEADGKRVFYSGDLRAHGRKSRLVEDLIRHPPAAIDVLLLEGTKLSRPDGSSPPETEQQLEARILDIIKRAPGLVLAAFSPQNIERFVTAFRATRRAGRGFVADLYLARILDELAMPSLPRASEDGLRVYLPAAQKRRIVIERDFDVLSPYRSSRIYPEEIIRHPAGWVMLFRESMTRDIERLGPRAASTLIYSIWPGYLNRGTSTLTAWCQRHGIAVELAHTSGHADAATLARLAKAINATAVVPVHTEAPLSMSSLIPNVRILHDGNWLAI